MIRVSTGARLHFGLFDVKAPFGGVGLMIDQPRTVVSIHAADRFSNYPANVDRVVEIVRRVAQRLESPHRWQAASLPNCCITIESAADAHCGLGSGTQLALTVAVALNEFFSLDLSRDELVFEIAARGRKSAIGSIGFFNGGLIAEAGGALSCETPSAWTRAELPERWRIVLSCPTSPDASISGEAERAAFEQLAPATSSQRSGLVQLSEQILHFGSTGDFERFCHSVADFNRRSGDLFAPHQGGSYNGPAVCELIQRLQSLGCVGVGQSSWGPTVFACCQNDDEALRLCYSLGDVQCRIVKPQPTGYVLERSPNTSCK